MFKFDEFNYKLEQVFGNFMIATDDLGVLTLIEWRKDPINPIATELPLSS